MMKYPPRAATAGAAVALIAAATAASATFGARALHRLTVPDTSVNGATLLPNGYQISPAGQAIALPGDFPQTMVQSPDGKYLIVNTAGFHNHSINVIDTATRQVVQSVGVPDDWVGMALSPDGGTLYVSSGGIGAKKAANAKKKPKKAAKQAEAAAAAEEEGAIMRYSFANGQLTAQAPLTPDGLDPVKRFVSGLAIAPDGTLYAADIRSDTVYRVPSPGRSSDPTVSGPAGKAPFGVALSPDGKTLAVSDWAEGMVRFLDPASLKETAKIEVGSHPNQIAWGKDGRLFVANSGSNSVSVIANGAVTETVKTSLAPDDPVGSTPVALVVSPDEKRLYVANADNNDVAVIDIADAKESRVLGFLPTGWYPSALNLSADGRRLYVGTAKGLGYKPNAQPKPAAEHDTEVAQEKQKFTYIPNILSGDVSVVDLPDANGLKAATDQVLANIPHPPYHAPLGSDDPLKQIKHVLYVIRENRTYDQDFGDIGRGNSEPSLCLFGQQVTPNAHALANQYVLLDNLYCNGEVSQSGHQWCDAAYATDYTEKAWPLGYSGRAAPPDDGMSQSPAGYLWDNCKAHGVTFRSYGEGSHFTASPGQPPKFAGQKTLEGHANAEYSLIPWFTGARDFGRAKLFIDDLHTAEQSGDWPQFMIMSLPEDHTQALSANAFTPFAHVGENDAALGQIVEAISHSRFWKDTAIFVVEDDAQNGPDHVDAHRTVGLVISPYIRPHSLDSTMYTQASMVRTIELILGLPPMTQYDRNATPMYGCFQPAPTLTAYNAIAPRVDVEARNPKAGAGAVASAKLDLSAPDRADPDKLNAILWHALKPGVAMPAPVRSAAWLTQPRVVQNRGIASARNCDDDD